MQVKWIKLNVGMFDGNSFKKIKKAKIGGESFRDKLTAVWFELLDFAGKCNAGGQLVESQEIPFASIDDIAILIDREPEELQLCMQFFITNRMVSVIDDVYMLTNWSKYQNEDGLEKIREQNRIRQKKWYDKQKALPNANLTLDLTLSNATDIDKEEDKDNQEIINNTPSEKPKAKQKANAFAHLIKDYDEDVRNLLLDWLEIRKKKRAAATETAILLNLNKLEGLAKESKMTVTEYLEEVVRRGWAAFYPIHSYDNPKKTEAKETPKVSYDLDAYQERALHSDLTYKRKDKK